MVERTARLTLKEQMMKIPLENFLHADRLDDDTHHILHIWDDKGNSFDIVAYKDERPKHIRQRINLSENELGWLASAKKCPFCGADWHSFCVMEIPFENDYYTAVSCSKCRAIGPQSGALHLAVQRWNVFGKQVNHTRYRDPENHA